MRFGLKTLLLAVLVSSVLVWAYVMLSGRYPIQIPMAPLRDAFEINYRSTIGSKTVQAEASLPSAYPCWYSYDSSPPLAASKAVLIASEKLKEIEDEITFDSIDLKSCNLCPWSPDEGYWYWQVEFHVWDDNSSWVPQADTLRMFVLMDGTCGSVSVKAD